MDIGKVMATTTETVVEFGGEQCRIRYFPNKFTPRMQAKLREEQAAMGQDPVAVLAPFVSQVVGDWDLTSEGHKIVPTLENCMDLPARFLDACIRAIAEDMSPNREPANGSVAGSFTAGN